MSDRWTGRLIDGRYVVESILGQGGMGVVLKARHKFTGAQVALKMLQPDLQVNADAKERFLAEAQTPTTIGHPGIVQVTDAGVSPEGELYLAMELLTGRTLRQAMYPSLPPQIARRILLELLDALGAAHARGIVHRDLKPENVFLVGPASTVKLLDFGIAKVVQAGRTAAGMMLGTLSYMAPEQLSDASSVDARADLWAVGVMVYEMLTGKLPFRGTQLAEIVAALAYQEPDPIRAYLPDATPAMDAFFVKALAKDRTQRFASAQDMALGISAMLIESSSPPVASTLNGLGSPRTSQRTAAESEPSRPPQFAPHVPPPGAPATAPGSTATPNTAPGAFTPPFTHPGATPSAPGLVPAPPAPTSPPPGAFTAPRPVAGPYGFVNDVPAPPPGYPPGHPSGDGFASPPQPKSTGLGMGSWLLFGGAAVLVLGVMLVLGMSSSKRDLPTECPAICEELQRCGAGVERVLGTDCVSTCEAAPEVKQCFAQEEGRCFGFLSCFKDATGAKLTE